MIEWACECATTDAGLTVSACDVGVCANICANISDRWTAVEVDVATAEIPALIEALLLMHATRGVDVSVLRAELLRVEAREIVAGTLGALARTARNE